MNLIIFGAGASFGSDSAHVPPLGSELLDTLAEFFPNAWGAIPEKYKNACRMDFEQGMQLLSDEQPTLLPPLQRAMAAYFFNFLPQKTNLYLRLAKLIKLSNWNLKGSLVTFNYERMLPHSLYVNGLQPTVGSKPANSNQIEICLPHGCCNLFCEAVKAYGNIVFTGIGISTDGEIKEINNPLEFHQRITSDKFPPVMSYFEPKKRTTSGVSFITNQRKRYEELVLDSTEIAIIGLKVRPHDNHIWDALAKTQAQVIYCSGKRGAIEFSDWAKNSRREKDDIVLNGYFAECFEEICSKVEVT